MKIIKFKFGGKWVLQRGTYFICAGFELLILEYLRKRRWQFPDTDYVLHFKIADIYQNDIEICISKNRICTRILIFITSKWFLCDFCITFVLEYLQPINTSCERISLSVTSIMERRKFISIKKSSSLIWQVDFLIRFSSTSNICQKKR